MSNSTRVHWDQTYAAKGEEAVSWFQGTPAHSLDLIVEAGIAADAPIVDVGGGASRLIDHLLDRGFANLTVVDVSAKALELTRTRLGEGASDVAFLGRRHHLLAATAACLRAVAHDRAVFHFLVDADARDAYLQALERGLAPGGFVVIATFAPSGPERCSGLPVCRYSAEALQATLGRGYALLDTVPETHLTPQGRQQDFVWCLFRKDPADTKAPA